MPRKGENIYKRQDGRWEGRYVKERNLKNEPRYGYVYGKSYYEVREKLINAKISGVNPALSKDKRLFGYFCTEWLCETQKRVKASTYAKYSNIINNHIIPIFGDFQISYITTDILKRYTVNKLDREHEGLSVKTVRDILSVIKSIFAFAQKEGAVLNCNLSEITVKLPKKSVSIFNRSEYNELLNYLVTDVDNTKLGVLICLCTGLRIGEICALTFNDISDGCVFVSKTMQRIQTMSHGAEVKTKIIITEPKSSTSIRYVPVPQFLSNIIKDFYSENAYVLTGKKDKYMEPRTLQNRFKKYLKACKISTVNFHICRHTYASYCIEAGVEIKCLSEMLGHSSVNITLNRYVHSSIDQKRENVKKLDEKIFYKPSNFSSDS